MLTKNFYLVSLARPPLFSTVFHSLIGLHLLHTGISLLTLTPEVTLVTWVWLYHSDFTQVLTMMARLLSVHNCILTPQNST